MENLLQILSKFSLLIDAGLVVLIWMVQLIIYPSFLYYKKSNLIKWHQKYTTQIAIIVVPFMSIQLIYGFLVTFNNPILTHFIYLLTVVFLWGFTFLGFAPIHFKISEEIVKKSMLKKLNYRNWIRTFLWTFVLILHLFFS